MNYENRIKSGVIHTHSRDSIFDGISSKKELIDAVHNLGGNGLLITDHGTLTGAMDDLAYAKKKGIKLLYGIEAYVDLDLGGVTKRTHLLLIAIDETGMYAINDAVTDSNKNLDNGFPCMTGAILEKNFGKDSNGYGHVIATSACIQGPLGTIISSNKIIEKEIIKVKNNLNKNSFSAEDCEKYKSSLNQIARNDETSAFYLEIISSLKTRKGKKPLNEKLAIEYLQSEIKELKASSNTEKAFIKDNKTSYEKYISLTDSLNNLSSNLKSDEVLYEEAKEYAKYLNELFGENNFFLELQYHFLKDEAKIMPVLAKISRELNLPVIAANDAHMATFSEENINARKVAQFLRYGNILDDNEDADYLTDKDGNTRIPDNELYIKSDYELAYALSHIASEDIVDEAMVNVEAIFNRCYEYVIPDKKYYPVYNPNLNAKDEIRRLAYEGIENRFPNRVGWNEIYQKRLEYELNVICSMGYADYHLIVREYLIFGKILGQTPKDMWDEVPMTSIEDAQAWFNEMLKTDSRFGIGIGIGEGRGSAAGSLVCYLLEISGIDPIRYDLLFERFLNPERISMPDIDSDFEPEVREKVIQYVINKYGEAAVCCIVTKSVADVKGACNSSARYLDALNNTVEKKRFISISDKISKTIDNDNELFKELDDCKTSTDKYNVLKKHFAGNEDAEEIITLASSVNGIITALGQHAAGVIIAGNGNVSKCIPLRYNTGKKSWTSQCDKEQAEASGLLKMDFLGLKTLGIITKALISIYENYGVKIDIRTVPYTNEELVAETLHHIYEAGRTVGIFQFESPGMQNLLKQASNYGKNPLSLEDLIMLNALYRPGPMEYCSAVCDVKNNRKPIVYDTIELEPILKETYGIMVYQEQVMRVCQNLAGYSLAQADNVRKYMSKKKTEALLEEREYFVNGSKERNIIGCVANGISAEIANKIFDDMIAFGKYAFNKSHAAIYAITSFYTAWLKYNYPFEFYTALLNYADDIEAISKYLFDIKKYDVNGRKIMVSNPDINLSNVDFTTDGKVIRFGLGSIKGFDSKLALEIINERKNGPYTSIHNFLQRVKCGIGSLEKLAETGAFDSLYNSRKGLLIKLPFLTKYAEEIRKKSIYISEGSDIIDRMESGAILLDDIKDLSMKEFKISSKTGRLPAIDKLKTRLISAKESLRFLIAEFNNISIDPVISDDDFLDSEKKLLGFYISKHPFDEYENDTPKPLNEVMANDTSISGLITRMRVVNGHRFFQLEDSSGAINCIIWKSSYERLGFDLTEGQAITINATVKTSTYNDEEQLQVVVDKKEQITFLNKKKKSFLLKVRDLTELLDNKNLIQRFENTEGHVLQVYDELFSEYRLYENKVHPNILNSGLRVSCN